MTSHRPAEVGDVFVSRRIDGSLVVYVVLTVDSRPMVHVTKPGGPSYVSIVGLDWLDRGQWMASNYEMM